MEKWKETELRDYINVVNGFAFKSKNFLNYQTEGALPVVKIKNVANGDVNLTGVQYHLYEEAFLPFLVDKGDLLIALTGNHPDAKTQVVGAISLYKMTKCSLLNQRVAKIIPKQGISKEYLYYFLKDEETRNWLAQQSSGSANQANISKKDIESVPILLPPLPEQRAIASVLSSLDDKIDLLHRQNATLEKMAETLFRQWFVEEAKEEWEEKPLSSIAIFLNGLACQKFPPKDGINKLPVLKIKELSGGITENSDWATTEISSEYVVNNGDVIFAWSASLMVKIWDGETCILNQHLFKVTSIDYPKWFYYLWSKQHLAEFQSIAASHATTMGHIKRKDLDEAMVLSPSSKELYVMTKQIEPLIENIISNSKQIRTLTSLRNILLPKLMNGEIRVKM